MAEHERNSHRRVEPEYCKSCGEQLLPDEAVCAACGTSVDFEHHELEEQRGPRAQLKRTEVKIAIVVAVILILILASFGIRWITVGAGDSIVGVGSHSEQLPSVDNPGEGLVVD